MTKVKCFHCHKMGHFATNCPLKKSKEKSSGGAAGEALASQFELEFSLIACMVSSMMGSVWYLDSDWTSKGNTCSVRLVKVFHHGEVYKVHLS
jgi:hypothetical protein